MTSNALRTARPARRRSLIAHLNTGRCGPKTKGTKHPCLERGPFKGSGFRPIYFGIRDFCRADRRPVRWGVFCVLPGGAGVPTAGRRGAEALGSPLLGSPADGQGATYQPRGAQGRPVGGFTDSKTGGHHAGRCEMKLSKDSQVLSWAAVLPSQTNVLFSISEPGYGFWLLRSRILDTAGYLRFFQTP